MIQLYLWVQREQTWRNRKKAELWHSKGASSGTKQQPWWKIGGAESKKAITAMIWNSADKFLSGRLFGGRVRQENLKLEVGKLRHAACRGISRWRKMGVVNGWTVETDGSGVGWCALHICMREEYLMHGHAWIESKMARNGATSMKSPWTSKSIMNHGRGGMLLWTTRIWLNAFSLAVA